MANNDSILNVRSDFTSNTDSFNKNAGNSNKALWEQISDVMLASETRRDITIDEIREKLPKFSEQQIK